MVDHCKKIFLLLLLFSASAALGQDKLDAALDAWIKSAGKSVMKHRVLVTLPLAEDKYPGVQLLKDNEYYRMLGFHQPSVANTRAFYLVNGIKPKSAIDAGKVLRMDFVLEVGDQDTQVTHLASEKSITIPNGTNDSDDDVIGRLRRGFGYDGYVVDGRQDLILARVTGKLLQKGSQAIIVNSDEPFLAPQTKVGAASLIEMVARRGDFGLFRVIIGKSGADLPKGSRVQFSTQ